MGKGRREFTAEFKFRVALDALRGTKTVSQLAGEYGVHPTQVCAWKKQLQEGGTGIFAVKASGQNREAARTEGELYEQIGRLKMELEWLKKKVAGIGGGASGHD